jgi:hypothetical protein
LTRFISILNKGKAVDVVPFIPKRGDKDFEPVESLAAKQQTALAKSRQAMFSALQAGDSRQHQSKAHNEAVWHPDLERGSMQSTAGIHFSTIGHFHPGRRRVELFPEEMLYLLERGTLECWTEQGVPMSAQQGFATFLGKDELTMERYQARAFACPCSGLTFEEDLCIPEAPRLHSAKSHARYKATVTHTACRGAFCIRAYAFVFPVVSLQSILPFPPHWCTSPDLRPAEPPTGFNFALD